jgi:hypothetical protein
MESVNTDDGTAVPKFDPAHPLPSKTVHMVRITGVGQASPARLRVCLLAAIALSLYFLLLSGSWWLGPWPLCLAAFSGWGLATKRVQSLDINHAEAPTLRAVLYATQGAAITLGVASALVGLTVLVGSAMRWQWVVMALDS